MRLIIDKRLYFTLVTSITISGFIVICAMGQNVRDEKMKSKIAAAAVEKQAPLFIVKEYDGKIGIFCRGNPEPFRYAEVSPGLLSDSDREQLSVGIGFETESELKAYLQDIES